MSKERVFEVDWAPTSLTMGRDPNTLVPTSTNWDTSSDFLGEDGFGNAIYFQEIDLTHLTEQGLAFEPLSVNIQRSWQAPRGQDANFMPGTYMSEYLYVFQSPLPNRSIANNPRAYIYAFKDLGLDRSSGLLTGFLDYIPNSEQLLFASYTKYSQNLAQSVSSWNGFADPADTYYPLLCQDPTVIETQTWGGMRPILGPRLYCYRVIFHETQNLTGLALTNSIVAATGSTIRSFSPITMQIFCKESDMSDGEYMITASNVFGRENGDRPNNI